VFIGFVGTSIAYPIFPPLFLHPKESTIIPITWDVSTRSILLGIALAAYPLGQFIGSPILGGCSDYYGRKKMLMLSLTGSAFGYLFTMLALQFNILWLLLASRFITGVMEGNLAIVRAMATDLKSISKYKSLGRINGVAAIGYVTGPLFGGFLSDSHLVSWFSYAFPFFLAMTFAFVAVLLAALKLSDKKQDTIYSSVTIMQRFNLIKRFKFLFSKSRSLKYLLIISTIFTFSADIFYEFGPVYLTGLWSMTPAGIAIYNAILSLTLAFGSGWLPHYFSSRVSTERVIATAMLMTAIIFGLLVIYPSIILAFVLFGLVGLSIAIVNTNLTIQVSDSVDGYIQGEALGAQLSLRMLGDAIICLVGGILIVTSVMLPIAISSFIAIGALFVYTVKFLRNGYDIKKIM
jgi:MFS transporter, DHA1 family, tetracycline resistance protein